MTPIAVPPKGEVGRPRSRDLPSDPDDWAELGDGQPVVVCPGDGYNLLGILPNRK